MLTTFVVSQLWGERIYDLKLSENVHNLCGIPTLGREDIDLKLSENVHNLCGIPTLGREDI